MSDERREASERESVFRERAAFLEGCAWVVEQPERTLTEAIAEAKKALSHA